MGNVCCSGRNHQSSNDSQNNGLIKNAPVETSQSENRIKKAPSPNVLEIAQINPEDLQISIEDPDLEPEIDYVERANTVNFLSNRTEIDQNLEYSLIMPEDLSKIQQTQVLSVLDNYKSLLSPDDQEQVDGFVYVTESQKNYLMMVSTHAIYLLNPDNVSLVESRTKLEDISLIVISKNYDVLLFVVKNSSEDFVVQCENMEGLVKSLQQVTVEAFGQYLPWITVEKAEDVHGMVNTVKVEGNLLLKDEHLAIVKAIVENGNIGETVMVKEMCTNSGESKLMNVNFVLTDQAIYILDSSYGFKKRISLLDIEKLAINKDSYLVIYEILGIHEFSLPQHFSDSIKQACAIKGNLVRIYVD